MTDRGDYYSGDVCGYAVEPSAPVCGGRVEYLIRWDGDDEEGLSCVEHAALARRMGGIVVIRSAGAA